MTRSRDVATQGGLVLVNTTTIGSAVSSVTISNCFSATYDAYQVIVSGGAGSGTDNDLRIRLGSSTTAYYSKLIYYNYSAGVANEFGNNYSSFPYFGGSETTGLSMSAFINNPYLAKYTTVSAPWFTSANAGHSSGIHKVATSYTDLVIVASAGTLTGGTIQVYGYKK